MTLGLPLSRNHTSPLGSRKKKQRSTQKRRVAKGMTSSSSGAVAADTAPAVSGVDWSKHLPSHLASLMEGLPEAAPRASKADADDADDADDAYGASERGDVESTDGLDDTDASGHVFMEVDEGSACATAGASGAAGLLLAQPPQTAPPADPALFSLYCTVLLNSGVLFERMGELQNAIRTYEYGIKVGRSRLMQERQRQQEEGADGIATNGTTNEGSLVVATGSDADVDVENIWGLGMDMEEEDGDDGSIGPGHMGLLAVVRQLWSAAESARLKYQERQVWILSNKHQGFDAKRRRSLLQRQRRNVKRQQKKRLLMPVLDASKQEEEEEPEEDEGDNDSEEEMESESESEEDSEEDEENIGEMLLHGSGDDSDEDEDDEARSERKRKERAERRRARKEAAKAERERFVPSYLRERQQHWQEQEQEKLKQVRNNAKLALSEARRACGIHAYFVYILHQLVINLAKSIDLLEEEGGHAGVGGAAADADGGMDAEVATATATVTAEEAKEPKDGAGATSRKLEKRGEGTKEEKGEKKEAGDQLAIANGQEGGPHGEQDLGEEGEYDEEEEEEGEEEYDPDAPHEPLEALGLYFHPWPQEPPVHDEVVVGNGGIAREPGKKGLVVKGLSGEQCLEACSARTGSSYIHPKNKHDSNQLDPSTEKKRHLHQLRLITPANPHIHIAALKVEVQTAAAIAFSALNTPLGLDLEAHLPADSASNGRGGGRAVRHRKQAAGKGVHGASSKHHHGQNSGDADSGLVPQWIRCDVFVQFVPDLVNELDVPPKYHDKIVREMQAMLTDLLLEPITKAREEAEAAEAEAEAAAKAKAAARAVAEAAGGESGGGAAGGQAAGGVDLLVLPAPLAPGEISALSKDDPVDSGSGLAGFVISPAQDTPTSARSNVSTASSFGAGGVSLEQMKQAALESETRELEKERARVEVAFKAVEMMQSLPAIELVAGCGMLAQCMLTVLGPTKLKVLQDHELDPLAWWIELPTPAPLLEQKVQVEGLYVDEETVETARLKKAKEDAQAQRIKKASAARKTLSAAGKGAAKAGAADAFGSAGQSKRANLGASLMGGSRSSKEDSGHEEEEKTSTHPLSAAAKKAAEAVGKTVPMVRLAKCGRYELLRQQAGEKASQLDVLVARAGLPYKRSQRDDQKFKARITGTVDSMFDIGARLTAQWLSPSVLMAKEREAKERKKKQEQKSAILQDRYWPTPQLVCEPMHSHTFMYLSSSSSFPVGTLFFTCTRSLAPRSSPTHTKWPA
jgi:hypothetical protein